MDPGLLDMLHDAGDEYLIAVGDRVDIDLDRVLQIAVDQHRVRPRDADRMRAYSGQPGVVVHDLHGAAAQHIGRPDHHRKADRGATASASSAEMGGAVLGLLQAEALQQLLEAAPVLGEIDRVGRGAEDRDARPPPAPRRASAAFGRRTAR